MSRWLIACTLLFFTGCTHVQLRRDTLHQAEAVHDVQQQMVLDNLAMFVENPNALPYFSEISGGFSQVNDTGSGSANPTWLASGFASIGLTVSGNRVNQEQFAFSPITDPNRLTWMRCAYRSAVGAPLDPREADECNAIIRTWDKSCSNCPPVPTDTPIAGNTQWCLPSCGWFCVVREHTSCGRQFVGGDRLPTDAQYVGRYGKTCIYVPKSGQQELGRLTMIVIGFASTQRQTSWQRNWMCDSKCPCVSPSPSMTPGTIGSGGAGFLASRGRREFWESTQPTKLFNHGDHEYWRESDGARWAEHTKENNASNEPVATGAATAIAADR